MVYLPALCAQGGPVLHPPAKWGILEKTPGGGLVNNKMPLDDVLGELDAWVRKNAASPRQQAALARQLCDGLTDRLRKPEPDTRHITAPNAVVEVVDEATGRLYRRYLELGYEESDNGLRLLGEDMSAAPVQIVYLSESALARMRELRGGGPETPRCQE